MLGSPCSPCCGCSAEEMLQVWRSLCGSTVTVWMTGTIPATDYAARVSYGVKSTFVDPNTVRHYITNAYVPSGWYRDGDIAGLGAIPKQNPADFATALPATFFQQKSRVDLTQYVLEPDLTTATNYRPSGYGTDFYTTTNVNGEHIVRFAGGSDTLKLLLIVRIGSGNASPWSVGASKCAVAATLYVASYRKFKVEYNAGARIGVKADEYSLVSQFVNQTYRNNYSTTTRQAIGMIDATPRAYEYNGVLGMDGYGNPPVPGGLGWYDSIQPPESQPWSVAVESYTAVPVEPSTSSSAAVPIVFAIRPQQWQTNPGPPATANQPLQYAGKFFITTSYTYDEYSAYGTFRGTQTVGAIVLDKAAGHATKAETMYLPAAGNWTPASFSASGMSRWLTPPSSPDSFGGLPQNSSTVKDASQAIAVTQCSAAPKANPMLPDGTPLAVYPEVVQEGTFYPGSTIRIRLRFPSRTDIYAPLVNYQQPNPNGGFFNSSYPTPLLVMFAGVTQQSAAYESGSGTDSLIFKYVVPENVTTSAGDSTAPPGLRVISLFWGTEVLHPELCNFYQTMPNTFVNPLPTFEVTRGLPVPPASVRNLVTGDIVEWKLTFPRDFTVTGSPKTSLRLSTGDSGLRSVSPSAVTGNTMVFSYTIQPNDRSTGVVMGTPFRQGFLIWDGEIRYSDGSRAMHNYARFPLAPGNPVVMTVNQ